MDAYNEAITVSGLQNALNFKHLNTLGLIQLECVTGETIAAIAKGCPFIEVLELGVREPNSELLEKERLKSSFPYLKKVVIED